MKPNFISALVITCLVLLNFACQKDEILESQPRFAEPAAVIDACEMEAMAMDSLSKNASQMSLKSATATIKPVTDCKFVGYGGYCTDGVLEIKGNCIPWKGKACEWLDNAKAAGYEISKTAVRGAIVVFPKAAVNGNQGHVGVMIDEKTMWSMNDECGRWTWTKRSVSAYANSKNKIAPIGYIKYKLNVNNFPADKKSCKK